MKTAAIIALAVLCAASNVAATNPDCQVCIDFSGTATGWDEVQSRIDPELYEPFSAYFCIYGTNDFSTITLMGSITPGMSSPPYFANLLPGDLAIGDWESGITMASTECLTDRFIYMARLDLIYLGTPGDVMFLDHPIWPRWVVDCDQPGSVDYYCVWMHGGVWKDPLEGDVECFPVVPVENSTWGSLKALYR